MTKLRAGGIMILLGVLAGFCQDADFFHGKCTGGIRSSAQWEHYTKGDYPWLRLLAILHKGECRSAWKSP